MRLCAVSVDLDEIANYAAIHGLPPPSAAAARAIYERALPRLARVFEDEGSPPRSSPSARTSTRRTPRGSPPCAAPGTRSATTRSRTATT
ncbi:MAG: hypothetical protein M5U28_32495 [Sandaracinaceae bacterium]|nr:hypothetical protein [Sandaracinaceae bacterium]